MCFCRRCGKDSRESWGSNRFNRRETVRNNDTVMEMLLVELEDGRAAPDPVSGRSV